MRFRYWLVLALALTGCPANPSKVDKVCDEIAGLTSAALADGTRTTEQEKRIAANGRAIQDHVRELTK